MADPSATLPGGKARVSRGRRKRAAYYLDTSPLDTTAVISEKSSAEFLPLISKHKSSIGIVAEMPSSSNSSSFAIFRNSILGSDIIGSKTRCFS
jgi:hypothetical protein